MQQRKNAAAFTAIKHVSQNIELKEDANHDALILAKIETKDTPDGQVMDLDALVYGCPCRLREILLGLMANDESFAAVVISAGELHKIKTNAGADYSVIKAAFHHSENIDATKN